MLHSSAYLHNNQYLIAYSSFESDSVFETGDLSIERLLGLWLGLPPRIVDILENKECKKCYTVSIINIEQNIKYKIQKLHLIFKCMCIYLPKSIETDRVWMHFLGLDFELFLDFLSERLLVEIFWNNESNEKKLERVWSQRTGSKYPQFL